VFIGHIIPTTQNVKIIASISSIVFATILFANPFAAIGVSTELWVAPSGSIENDGSQTRPLPSVPAALKIWQRRLQTPSATSADSLHIILRDGLYPLNQAVSFDSELFANKKSSVCIEAAPGEHPVLSGGAEIIHWKKVAGKISHPPGIWTNDIWVADVPLFGGRTLAFRQLWVNGSKAIRAREPNGNTLMRLIAWDRANQIATIPAEAVARIQNSKGLEMIINQVWEIAILRVKSLSLKGTNALATFEQPESKIEFEHPWPPIIVKTNYAAPFYLANAMEFLDSPGEWFEDLSAGKIYYWPRSGEDMTRAKIVAPVLKTLVQIDGSLDKPVSNIHFKGITFEHTTWLRPSKSGHVPLQAGMFLIHAEKLSPRGTSYHPDLDNLAWINRPPAAVEVQNADHISFENCTFEHLASAGLDFASGTRDDLVEGCVFRDIGGNGIQLGKFSDENVETHTPYIPSDEREICTREKISNNVITDCGNEDWGCVGIGVGYARDVAIEHNEVFNLPYTGISVGWGWTKATNCMNGNILFANHVHHIGQRLGDLGGIYTLSAQPGTVIAENFISDIEPSPYVPDPSHWFYLYLDEGSSGITVRDNWCPSEKFLKNANGPGNVWTNNGPQVSEKIKNAAGLEPAFQSLLK
jgi:hypothetical protein